MAYTMNDYREALSERDNLEMESAEWKEAQKKVQQIVEEMVKSGDRAMVGEVMDEVYSLLECGFTLDDEEVKQDIELLEKYGFTEEAQELRELD